MRLPHLPERSDPVSTITESQRVSIKRIVTVEFDESEYLPVDGDLKPGGGRRAARVTAVDITYTWTKAAMWSASLWSVAASRQQQKENGSWGEPGGVKYALSDYFISSLINRYRPTSTITITEY